MHPRLVYGYKSEWRDRVLAVFNKTEMKRDLSLTDMLDRAFQNSQVVASLWIDDRIIAVGRMITDFQMYSAIFDVVVDPEFQKKGLGKQIILALVEKAPGTCIHLTSTFGNTVNQSKKPALNF